MEVFGIGPMELILILIIAMMVFGPDKMPEIGAKLGQSMRAMRRATREFSKEVEGARQAIEAPIQEIKQPLQEVTQPIQEMRQQFAELAPLAQAVTNPQEALRQAVTPSIAPPRPSDGTGPNKVTNGAVDSPAADKVDMDAGVVETAVLEAPIEDANRPDASEASIPDAAFPANELESAAAREEAPAAPEASRQHIIFPED